MYHWNVGIQQENVGVEISAFQLSLRVYSQMSHQNILDGFCRPTHIFSLLSKKQSKLIRSPVCLCVYVPLITFSRGSRFDLFNPIASMFKNYWASKLLGEPWSTLDCLCTMVTKLFTVGNHGKHCNHSNQVVLDFIYHGNRVIYCRQPW
jgi:hypothetical protein